MPDRITGLPMERAIRETDRRRAKQVAYNEAHGITPETVRKNVEDVLAGLYKGDVDMNRVTATIDKPLHGANLAAVLDGLRTDMRKAAENLEFEEAAPARRDQAARSGGPRGVGRSAGAGNRRWRPRPRLRWAHADGRRQGAPGTRGGT